jgi:penicillin-binding protein 2
MNDIQNGKDEHFLESWRMFVIYGLVISLFSYYAFRLFKLQVIDGANYVARAEENRTTQVSDVTQRGIIYDRNGIVLARNVASYNVTITPAYLPVSLPITYEEAVPGPDQEIYRRLSKLVGVPITAGAVMQDDQMTLTEDIVKVFKPCETTLGIKEIAYIQDTTAPYDSVRIACNIDPQIAMQIREQAADMPGVNIEVEPVRDYPTGELTAELIGFLGPVPANQEQYYREKGFIPGRDKVGYAGLENSLQDILGGRNGERMVEVDVAGRELRNLAEPVKPVAGNNVRLTIDTRLQQAAREALTIEINYWNRYLGRIQSTSGVVIAMNPKTGEVLAMVSYPSYENNRFAKLIPSYYYNQLSVDPAKPLLNKAVSGSYPPGSVFKLPTAIGALNERVVAPDQKLNDPGKIVIEERRLPNLPPSGTRTYVCWNAAGHGDMDWLHGVENSCDVYFYKIGGGYENEVPNGGLGIWRLGEYARALGYGAVSGIELPGEQKGLIPDPDWKRVNQGESWTTGDTYIASMGQGLITSTPLQVLMSAATLANDGKLMKPTLIHEVLDSEGNVIKPFEPDLRWDITNDKVIQIYENSIGTGKYKSVEPWVVQMAKQAMRLVVTEGTAKRPMQEEIGLEQLNPPILSAGKTGTAEYCDDIAMAANRCSSGNWPTHSWYFGYAPYDNPEIAVVAFVYNGGEGASVAAPIVGKVLEAYFNLKAIDARKGAPGE